MAIHDLTFTDWENYTDGDGNAFTLPWTDAAAMRGTSPYPYLEAIRQATNARIEMTPFYDRDPAIYFDAAYADEWAIAPLTSAPFYTAWANTVVRRAIEYVWCYKYFQKTSLQWLVPESVPTLHNVTLKGIKALSPYYYSGPAMEASSTGEVIRERMLDAAGISDATLRAWLMAISYTGYEYEALGQPYVFPFSDIILALKKLLSLLTYCVDTEEIRHVPTELPLGGLTRTVSEDYNTFAGSTQRYWNYTDFSVGYYKIKELRAQYTLDALDSAKAGFPANWVASVWDGAAWVGPPSDGLRRSGLAVFNAREIFFEPGGGGGGPGTYVDMFCRISRVRQGHELKLLGSSNRSTAIGYGIQGAGEGAGFYGTTPYGRDCFNPWDFTGITEVPDTDWGTLYTYTPTTPWDDDVYVYVQESPAVSLAGGWHSFVTGDKSASLATWQNQIVQKDWEWYVAPPLNTGVQGWETSSEVTTVQNFNVAGGFIFR